MAIKADFSKCDIKLPTPNTDVVVKPTKKLDLFEFLKEHNVEITFSTTCRDCGYSYLELKHDEYHDCKLPEGKAKMVFPEKMVIEAWKEVDEIFLKLGLKDEPSQSQR